MALASLQSTEKLCSYYRAAAQVFPVLCISLCYPLHMVNDQPLVRSRILHIAPRTPYFVLLGKSKNEAEILPCTASLRKRRH